MVTERTVQLLRLVRDVSVDVESTLAAVTQKGMPREAAAERLTQCLLTLRLIDELSVRLGPSGMTEAVAFVRRSSSELQGLIQSMC